MTSATEKLRQMLDEREVKWKDYGYDNHTWWREWHAENRASANGLYVKVEAVLTPEQAIAATLGGANVDDVLALLDEMNEQGRIEYADYSQLHDAIAATLGRGTCHDVWQDDPFANFKCSECNEELHYRDKKRIACCPFCKREVVSADD